MLYYSIVATHSSRNKNHKGLPSHDKFLQDIQSCCEETENTSLYWKKVETVQKPPETMNSLTQRQDIIPKNKSLHALLPIYIVAW